ncbi:MAG TPA: glycosyltransferase family 2 protein [Rhabdochlamydiaceae bacterium]|nr:glycosyltransferase family 2 protein [Rhabdochlamydiaceae bacterium]
MISVTILTKNSRRTLQKTLESVRSFSEVVILDTGSTDQTLFLAKEYLNTKIYTSPFLGFGALHNEAAHLATHDWILSLDSDEVLTAELIEEIQGLVLDPTCVYSIERHNFFNGKRIKWCGGWHPDRVVRLFHRKSACFSDDQVHEKVITQHLKEISLQSPLLHTPYLEIADFLDKMQHYTTLFADQEKRKKKVSVFKALYHSFYAFAKSYIFKRGFLGGKEGFIISMYNGHSTFYKYLKLAERCDKK